MKLKARIKIYVVDNGVLLEIVPQGGTFSEVMTNSFCRRNGGRERILFRTGGKQDLADLHYVIDEILGKVSVEGDEE